MVDYIEAEGIEVKDAVNFSILDSLEVGARDPMRLLDDVRRLDVAGVDTVVLSACVQMPSFPPSSRRRPCWASRSPRPRSAPRGR